MSDKRVLKYIIRDLLSYALIIAAAAVGIYGFLWVVGWLVELISDHIPDWASFGSLMAICFGSLFRCVSR